MVKEPVKKKFRIGGQEIETGKVEEWEVEELKEEPRLPPHLFPVWDAFDCLGPEFSYESELVPHLDRRCQDDYEFWYWMEHLVLHLRKEYNKHTAQKIKNTKNSPRKKTNSANPNKPALGKK